MPRIHYFYNHNNEYVKVYIKRKFEIGALINKYLKNLSFPNSKILAFRNNIHVEIFITNRVKAYLPLSMSLLNHFT